MKPSLFLGLAAMVIAATDSSPLRAQDDAMAAAGQNRAVKVGPTSIQMQWIPAGKFRMGNARYGPVTRVAITRGFWLGRFEITQRQWQEVMGSNPSHFKYVGLDAPVENISWNDAMEFCRRVSAAQTKTGEVPAGYAYRLPTEAEWEYACRAGTTGEFSGDGVVSDMGWYYDWDNGNADLRSHVVGEKMANGFGLYDMHGNVNEWCFDWYGPYSGGEVADPAGPKSGVDRVIRGGSWQNMPEDLGSAFRNSIEPDDRVFNVGFRLALAPRLP